MAPWDILKCHLWGIGKKKYIYGITDSQNGASRLKTGCDAAAVMENVSQTSHRGWESNAIITSFLNGGGQELQSTCQSRIINRMKTDAAVKLKSEFT